MVQNQVLAKIASEDVAVFVVWIPTFPGDNRQKALRRRNLLPDRRVRQFWDGDLRLGKRYRDVLSLPESIEVAWDVYFAFDRQTEWTEEPPPPAFWQHQLSGAESSRRLNGPQLRENAEELLESR